MKITLLYGGLSALLVTLLGANVSLIRMRDKLYAGDPTPKSFLRKIRAHGNAAEWIPLGIVLLLILEMGGVGSMWLHVFGGLFLTSRLMHALGFVAGVPTSAMGATLTYLVMLAMSSYAVALHFM